MVRFKSKLSSFCPRHAAIMKLFFQSPRRETDASPFNLIIWFLSDSMQASWLTFQPIPICLQGKEQYWPSHVIWKLKLILCPYQQLRSQPISCPGADGEEVRPFHYFSAPMRHSTPPSHHTSLHFKAVQWRGRTRGPKLLTSLWDKQPHCCLPPQQSCTLFCPHPQNGRTATVYQVLPRIHTCSF